MIINTELRRDSRPISPHKYQVDKIIELPRDLFTRFMIHPEDHYEFIEQNKVRAYQYSYNIHCLLALRKDHIDGVLIQCGDDGYARYTAYVAGARDIVQAKLDQAVDYIVQQGTEHTASGYWCVYFEELEERFGLTIPKGSGLDAMLKDALERRPEVATVEIHDGAIETTFHPEFCEGLRGSTVMEKPDIRVRDILPLLTGGGLTFLTHEEADTSVLAENLRELTAAGREDHAALLDAQVAEICLSSEGLEIVLTDVAPEELARFNDAYEAFMDAEQAMGPAM